MANARSRDDFICKSLFSSIFSLWSISTHQQVRGTCRRVSEIECCNTWKIYVSELYAKLKS
jgi:hypothetical protein